MLLNNIEIIIINDAKFGTLSEIFLILKKFVDKTSTQHYF
jgi:hypothetical protein